MIAVRRVTNIPLQVRELFHGSKNDFLHDYEKHAHFSKDVKFSVKRSLDQDDPCYAYPSVPRPGENEDEIERNSIHEDPCYYHPKVLLDGRILGHKISGGWEKLVEIDERGDGQSEFKKLTKKSLERIENELFGYTQGVRT